MPEHRVRCVMEHRDWLTRDGRTFCHYGLNRLFVIPRKTTVIDMVFAWDPWSDGWLDDPTTYCCIRCSRSQRAVYAVDIGEDEDDGSRIYNIVTFPFVPREAGDSEIGLSIEIIR